MARSRHRKAPKATAWSQGTNPITNRPTNIQPTNGVNPPQPSTLPAKGNAPDKDANDRLAHLFANYVGRSVTATLKNGESYQGVFTAANIEPAQSRYVFRMTKRISTDAQANGTTNEEGEYVGTGEDHVMSFEKEDVVLLAVPGLVFDKTLTKNQNGIPPAMKTDVDISGNRSIRQRPLKRWEPTEAETTNFSLDEGSLGTWDQFATNEALTGQKSTYDEDQYTTTINRSGPDYAAKAARAAELEREILGTKAMNSHVAEERGSTGLDDSGMDEEEKYSGVNRNTQPLTSGQPNKYTPPAKRPPTGQPGVPGVPVDPAIISSQMARPKPSAQQTPSQPEKLIVPEEPAANASSNARSAVEPVKPDIALQTGAAVNATAASTDNVPKTTVDPKPKPVSSSKPTAAPSSTLRNVGNRKPENATATVEVDVFDAFKQFSATEKMRIQKQQRTQALQDKMVKLNDLKKFSQNFKLESSVPADLVPILSKDKIKQQAIVERAQKQMEEVKKAKASKPAVPAVPDQKQAPTTQQQPQPGTAPATAAVDKQNFRAGRPPQGPYPHPRGNQAAQTANIPMMPQQHGQGRGLLSQRLAVTQQQHKAGTGTANLPHIPPMPIQDPRMPPTGPSMNTMQAPPSGPAAGVAAKFNAKASEFRPNPAASTFSPVPNQSNTPSPRPPPPVESAPRPKPVPRKVSPNEFWAGRKPTALEERASFSESFNCVKRKKEDADAEGKTKEYAINGGIPQAYRTPPRWDVSDTNKDRSYKDLFTPAPTPVQPTAQAPNAQIPHQHQLPQYLQNGAPPPPHHTPHATPRHMPAQPYHGPGHHQHDDHRMQFSHSQSSAHASPRPMQPYPAYPQHGAQQPMPVYQQMPMNMAPGGQIPFRPMPPGQFMAQPTPGMPGHMMPNQPGVQYMGMPMNGPVPMYSPSQGHVYPHATHMSHPPNPNGYGSPRPPAAPPMMSHQGSQQGHMQQGVMYMHPGGPQQPMYPHNQSGPGTPMRGPHPQPYGQPAYGTPHQQHHFQQRGTPGQQFSQPMMPTHSMPPQMPPQQPPVPSQQSGGETVGGEEAK